MVELVNASETKHKLNASINYLSQTNVSFNVWRFSGEFADVYRGTLKIDPESETVAVKILKVGLANNLGNCCF